jgi:para-aminobenzoate synthetase component I
MNTGEFAKKVTQYASKGEPFVFAVDFELRDALICKPAEAAGNGIFYNVRGNTNLSRPGNMTGVEMDFTPTDKKNFSQKFRSVLSHLKKGDSYLLNLTFPTEITVNMSLEEIFMAARAPYRFLLKDRFVVFSPECFIRTEDDEIFTYPMKGTIDAATENAEQLLIGNRKEEWEHNTIVDLMRNDLSMIAGNVRVTRYRYTERIRTHKNEILQTSSEICGALPPDWRDDLGNSLLRILPPGSVSGAPKRKTLEIIRENESGPRGYYSGIFGIFDGKDLDTAVAIRFIEKRNNKTFFRSGCGITAHSNEEDEYNELIQKIYVPAY